MVARIAPATNASKRASIPPEVACWPIHRSASATGGTLRAEPA